MPARARGGSRIRTRPDERQDEQAAEEHSARGPFRLHREQAGDGPEDRDGNHRRRLEAAGEVPRHPAESFDHGGEGEDEARDQQGQPDPDRGTRQCTGRATPPPSNKQAGEEEEPGTVEGHAVCSGSRLVSPSSLPPRMSRTRILRMKGYPIRPGKPGGERKSCPKGRSRDAVVRSDRGTREGTIVALRPRSRARFRGWHRRE